MPDLISFKELLDHIKQLPPEQIEALKKQLFSEKDESIRKAKENGLLLKEDGTPICCPFCGSVSIGNHGYTKYDKKRYRCKDCKKTFSETSKSFFDHTHLDEWQWKEVIRGVIHNLSTGQIANAIGTSEKTAWLAKSKIMQIISLATGTQDTFKGIVECDEVEFHLSFKAKKDAEFFVFQLGRMPRHHRSRAEKIEYLKKYGLWEKLQEDPEFLEWLLKNHRRSADSIKGSKNDSVTLVTAVERGDGLYIKPATVGKLETTHVTEHFEGRLEPDSVLVTDGNQSYNWYAELNNIHHEVVPADKHAVGPYNLAHVNALHASLSAYYPRHKNNLPATKHLELGTDVFWWLEKNKGKPLQELIDEVWKLINEVDFAYRYQELIRQILHIDTKGLFPKEV